MYNALTIKQKKQEETKMQFINMVYDKRDILFGKYDESITKDAKRLAWIEIDESMKALDIHLIPAGKDWTYLRDVTWRNLLASARKRHDAKKKTGAGQVGILKILKQLKIFCLEIVIER